MSVALEQADLVLTKLEETKAEAEFYKICSLCQDRVVEFRVKCEILRLVGTQKYRANYDCSSAEEYYVSPLFFLYIDDLKASLKRRASKTITKHSTVCNLCCKAHLQR